MSTDWTLHDAEWNYYARHAREDMIKWGGVCGWCLQPFATCGHTPPKIQGTAPRKQTYVKRQAYYGGANLSNSKFLET